MKKSDKNENKPIKGVICEAVNCQYNSGEGQCCASQIAVAPIYAQACTDTVCATFKLKDGLRR